MKKNNIYLNTLICSLVFIALFALGIRKFRALFPPTEIGSEKLVGYSQYFGYPLYFDNIFFIILILFPPLIFLYFYFRKNQQ